MLEASACKRLQANEEVDKTGDRRAWEWTGSHEGGRGGGHHPHLLGLPRTDILLGRMVTAPSATSSRRSTGALLEPQLSEPIQKKWPVWLALRAASSTLLWGHSSPAQVHMAAQLPHPPCLSPRLYLDPPSTL